MKWPRKFANQLINAKSKAEQKRIWASVPKIYRSLVQEHYENWQALNKGKGVGGEGR